MYVDMHCQKVDVGFLALYVPFGAVCWLAWGKPFRRWMLLFGAGCSFWRWALKIHCRKEALGVLWDRRRRRRRRLNVFMDQPSFPERLAE